MNFPLFSIQYLRNGTLVFVNTVLLTSTTAGNKNPTAFTFLDK